MAPTKGTAVLLVCIFAMEMNSDVADAIGPLRNEVSMFNMARELEDAAAKDRLQNWLGGGDSTSFDGGWELADLSL